MKATYQIETETRAFEVADIDRRFSTAKSQVEKMIGRKLVEEDTGPGMLVGSKGWTVEVYEYEDAEQMLVLVYNRDRLAFVNMSYEEYNDAMATIGRSFVQDANRMEDFARACGLPDSVQIKASRSVFYA